MLFLIKNSIREIKCYVKNYWWFLLVVLFGCFFLTNIQQTNVIGPAFSQSKIIVKIGLILVLWGYAFLGQAPIILINPANFIYRQWHKNRISLLINYTFKSISISLLIYAVLRIFIKDNLGIVFVQSVLLTQMSFLIKWKIYHEEKIKWIPLITLTVCSVIYIIESYYWGIIFEVICCLFLSLNLPKINLIKYFEDLKFIYINKNASIRGDYSAAAKLADSYNSQKEYSLTLSKDHLKWPIIGKSLYIDTIRASAGRWGIKVILLLIVIIMEVVKWKYSYIMSICSLAILNVLILLLVNEYFYYAEQLVDNSRKGLFLPIAPIKLTISAMTMPSVFISMVYALYSFLNGYSIFLLVTLILVNIIINFLQFLTVFINRKKRKLIILGLNILRVGTIFLLV